MTIGSAASLAAMPQGPLSLFRTPGIGVVQPEFGDAAPRRTVSLHKAAGNPPGPHVLVVEDDASAALEIQQRLRECGYRVVGPAGSPDEAQRLVALGRRPIHCALLAACMPNAAAAADDLLGRGIPVVWIASASDAYSWDRRDEPVLRQSFAPEELRDAIERASAQVARRRLYVTPPPQTVWPRVFPQL